MKITLQDFLKEFGLNPYDAVKLKNDGYIDEIYIEVTDNKVFRMIKQAKNIQTIEADITIDTVKELLEMYGWTQAEFARKIGVTNACITNAKKSPYGFTTSLKKKIRDLISTL